MGSRKERIIPIQLKDDEPINETQKSLRSRNIQSNVDKSADLPEPDKNRDGKESTKETEVQQVNIEMPKRILPSYNVPEKIIIAVDRAQDENCSNFIVSGKSYAPLLMMKKATEIFLYNKNSINPSHQFALMELNENNVEWLHDFTNYPQDIISSLTFIRECETEDIFNLDRVFNMINRKIALNVAKNNLEHIPNFVVRLILFYSRSYTIPQLERTEEIDHLLKSPYFTVDVVMTHEPPSSANNCDKIFQILQSLDDKGFSYSFAVARRSADLYIAMAKLLSHPLQRPPQSYAKYTLEKISEV